jgi:predicted nucleotide-binding protein (sugar kinase/HSP70/actin superfamily)
MAIKLGASFKTANNAFDYACKKQDDFEKELKVYGKKALHYLENNPEKTGIVLLGRPYNSFTDEANLGIPSKVASQGYLIIPYDMLPCDQYLTHHKMFWAMGQKIMKAAQLVKDKNNLFGLYITNFSCGPDSFLLTFFRNVMGNKPSLTLELDQHSADAGIDTRIEAALEVMNRFRRHEKPRSEITAFKAAKVLPDSPPRIISSSGIVYSIFDPNVEVVLPSMGQYGTEILAAIMRSFGINAKALPIPQKETLLEGRKNTTGKECLPYILTSGSFLEYLKQKKNPEKVTLLFMATGGGPCRLGQYWPGLEQMIVNNKIPNVAVLTLTDENSYAGMGRRMLLKAWQGIIISDIFSDIKSMLSVCAKDKNDALEMLGHLWNSILFHFEFESSKSLFVFLNEVSSKLSAVPLKKTPRDIPVISLVGEIFVRKEEFSRKGIVETLEQNGFMVRVAPIAEFMYYGNYVINNGLGERQFTFFEHIKMRITAFVQQWWERKIKAAFAASGLYHYEMIDVSKTIDGVRHLVNENLRGECILTIGLAMREILEPSCGVISIGPFGCMPSRTAESILKKEMDIKGKERMATWKRSPDLADKLDTLPFLAIETDGNSFPQIIQANLESFLLQARKIHEIRPAFLIKDDKSKRRFHKRMLTHIQKNALIRFINQIF